MPLLWQRMVGSVRRRKSACALLALLVVAIGTVLSQTGPPRGFLERLQENRRREASSPKLFFRADEHQETTSDNPSPAPVESAPAEPAPRKLGQGRMFERARQRLGQERHDGRTYTPASALPDRGYGYTGPPQYTPASALPDRGYGYTGRPQYTPASVLPAGSPMVAAAPPPRTMVDQRVAEGPTLPHEVPIYDSLRPRLGVLDEGAMLPAASAEPEPRARIVFDDKVDVVDLTEPAEAAGDAESAAPINDQNVMAPESLGSDDGVITAIVDPAKATSGIEQAGCVGCGGSGGMISPYHAAGPVTPVGGLFPHAGCSSCGVGMGTCAGIPPCYPCEAKTVFGRFFYGVYQCICCPDPCYDPHWIPIADAAFFTEAARPISQTRLRWDTGINLIFPDRSEYFWARSDGLGLGPTPNPPLRGPKRLNYYDLSLYVETASDLFSFSVNTPYRSVAPEGIANASGFGDIDLATKTLLYDCELFQIAMMMRTYILSGNFKKGLGTGHISLEPSFVVGVRLGPETYLQTQVADWIPFGTPGYSGSVLRFSGSLNHVLYRLYPNVPLIGTLEMQGLYFMSGAYTDPTKGSFQPSAGGLYLNFAPGLRMVMCDKIDVGVGTLFSVTDQHFAEQLIRAEMRLRF